MGRPITAWPCGGIRAPTEAGYDWTRPELYQHIAQVCERGSSTWSSSPTSTTSPTPIAGSLEPALRYATQAPEHDPIPLLSFMAAVTKHIGLGATFSISHSIPSMRPASGRRSTT